MVPCYFNNAVRLENTFDGGLYDSQVMAMLISGSNIWAFHAYLEAFLEDRSNPKQMIEYLLFTQN